MKKLTPLLFVMMLSNFCKAQAPPNDNCPGSMLTPSVTCTATAGSLFGATPSGVTACTGTPDDDVWYSFVATSTSHIITVTPCATMDVVMQVFAGSCGGTSINCTNMGGAGVPETVTVLTTAGTTYWIRVYDFTGAPPCISFGICITTPAVNDDCSSAIMLTPSATCVPTTGTDVGATASPVVASACGGNPDDDVWYSFVAASSYETITVQGCASFNAVIDLYSGSCAALTNITCVNATGAGGSETLSLITLVPGTTYYIRVYDFGTGIPACNTFTICVTTPLTNDNCAGAQIITPTCTATLGTSMLNGDVAGATQSLPATCTIFGSANEDVWYRFTTSAVAGQPYVITVVGSASFDAVFQVYSGSCGGTNVTCVNANGMGGAETTTLLALAVSTQYWIRVYDAGTGTPATTTFTISITTPSSVPTVANLGPDIILPCGSSTYAWIRTPYGPNAQYTWTADMAETVIAGIGTDSIAVAFIGPGFPSYRNIVMVTDTSVCGTTTYDTMYITVATPGINFTIVPDSANPYNYTFFNATPGTILSYSWDFGDGSAISTAASPSHTYASTGTYNVCLGVTTSACSGSLCDSVFVTGVTNACNALFNVAHDTASSNPNGYIVTNLSYGATLTYTWDFGDGTFAYVPHPTHTYAAIGPYQLCLNVNDGMGCSSNYCDSIYAVDSLHTHLHPIQITVVGAGSSTTVSVANVDDSGEWVISPNPSEGVFQISNTKQKIKEIRVFDVLGKMVNDKWLMVNGSATIDISGYSKGIYFVKIMDEKKNVVNRKIVIQ